MSGPLLSSQSQSGPVVKTVPTEITRTFFNPVPVTIVTGFLGSGKTTLINHVLADCGGKEKLAIIKNEIGDIAVDSKVIKGKNIVIKELLNGCVCCTLVGNLEDSMEELVETVCPDRIIIETSGAANPAILAVNIDRLSFVKRDLIVTVIDCLHFPGYKDKTMVARLQHKFTDLVVLNRVREVDKTVIESILDDVYEQCPGIPVVRTKNGRVDPELMFGIGKTLRPVLSSVIKKGIDHLALDGIDAFSYSSEHPLNREIFETILNGLSSEFFRVKGFALFAGEKLPKLVNWVCGKLEIEELDSAGVGGTSLIFIGIGVGQYSKHIEQSLEKDRIAKGR